VTVGEVNYFLLASMAQIPFSPIFQKYFSLENLAEGKENRKKFFLFQRGFCFILFCFFKTK